MWRPDAVVSEHKRRAIALWVILIVGIIVYASWLLASTLKKRDTPSTFSEISNKVYSYPDTWVCLYNTYGCDEMEREERCINSSTQTDGGNTSAVFFPGGEFFPGENYEQEVSAVGKLTESKGWCVEFKTSDVTAFEGEERLASNYLDYFLLDMYWYPGGTAGASTTCVPDGEEWKPHNERVFLYLDDPATSVLSAGIQIPYSCITEKSNSHVSTYLGFGLTEQRNIKRDNTFTYKALSITSFTSKHSVKSNLTSPYAYLALEIKQETNSFEIITEVDPLDVAELLGNIGGFWDLLLILWPLFFVAATRQDPHFKARDFKKSAEWAAERAKLSAATVASIPRPVKGVTTFEGLRSNPGKTEGPVESRHWAATVTPEHLEPDLARSVNAEGGYV